MGRRQGTFDRLKPYDIYSAFEVQHAMAGAIRGTELSRPTPAKKLAQLAPTTRQLVQAVK